MVLRARRYWLAGGMALLSAATMAGSETAGGEMADVEQLRRQSAAWDQAIVRKDRAAIEANMAADFRQIDADADLETKASFVDGLMSPKLVIAPYQVEDFEIRLYGDTALLSGRTRMHGTYDGRPFSTHYRYIDVYVRREGRWQIVSVQLTRINER